MNTWLALSRAVHFGSCLLVLGVWVFDRLVARSVAGLWRPIARRLIVAALPLVLVSGAAWFAMITIEMSGLPVWRALQPITLRLVWNHTHFGILWKLRLVFWVIAACAAAAGLWVRRLGWVALAGSIPLVASLAWAGHGRFGRAPMWHVSADVVHLLAAACWPAGLLPMGILLLKIRRAAMADKWIVIGDIVRRFSAMSLAAVGILAASGLVNGYFLVGSVSNLFFTPYGRMLLVKIILFFLAMGIGAVNLLRLKPRLSLNAARHGEKTARGLQMNIAGELVLITLILLATGALGLLPPAAR